MTVIVLQAIQTRVAASAHLYRQIVATFAASLLSLAGGITFGFTAVLLPQLEKDSSFPYDKSFDSWIASISVLAMMLGSLFSGSLSDGIGRKMGQLVLIIPFTLAWVMMGLAPNNAVMLIGRFITGLCAGSVRANSVVYIGELSDPKYRAMALFCPSAAIQVGALMSHLVGTYCHWKTSCFIFTIPNVISFVVLMFLKESPLWLLTKGKIDEGIESFRQFRGNGESAEKELSTVLEKVKEKTEESSSIKETLAILFSKPFMKSMITVFVVSVAIQWNGINTLTFYAQEIFERTFSGNIDAFMLMVLTDCIRLLAAVIICIFARVMPFRITFVVCSILTTIVLVGLVIYLYLSPVGLAWVAFTCMAIYIGAASAMASISWTFIAEIFPSKVRGLGSGLSSGLVFILLFISVKVTPEIMNTFGEKVMYAGFAVITLITGILTGFMLPETKGRTLQDIEDTLYKKKSDVKKDIEGVNLPNLSVQLVVDK